MLQELGYLNGSVIEPYKVSWCPLVDLWNDVAGDLLSVGTWFGTYCAPGIRMQALGLVYPLFVAQSTWFGISDVCRAEEKWVEHGIECHEIRDDINV